MKMENFSAAVEFYSKAITVNPHNAVYFCNRWVLFVSSLPHQAGGSVTKVSRVTRVRPGCACLRRAAAHSKLGNYAGAVQDCEQAISIDPNYSKAYGRMG